MTVPSYIAADLNACRKCLSEARAKGDAAEEARIWARLNYLLDRLSEMRREAETN